MNNTHIIQVRLMGFIKKLSGSQLPTHDLLWSKFELIRDFMAAHALVACKNEADQYNNKSARVTSTLNIDFSDASYFFF